MPKGYGSSRLSAVVVGDGPDRQRVDQLELIVEHCQAAKVIADAQGDRFLSYMLDMAVQAAQAAKCTKS